MHRYALEDVSDADPGLLQHVRLSGHDPAEVRPDQHRGDLEDHLVDVGVARQLAPDHGLDDMWLMPEALNDTWRYLEQDLTLVTVPNAGHWVHLDAADEVNRLLIDFLQTG